MKPADLAKAGSEHAHQMAIFCWASYQLALWPQLKWLYAIPNGGERNIIVAGSLKAEGVKSGVSDLCLPFPSRGYYGLYIEMKKPGKLSSESKNQKEFGAFVTENGYFYQCLDHWEKAAQLIAWYLGRDDGAF